MCSNCCWIYWLPNGHLNLYLFFQLNFLPENVYFKRMKKILLLCFLSLFSVYVFGQKDAAARAILNKVSAKYRTYRCIKTDFDFTLNNQQANIRETRYGTLIAESRANKFRMTIYSPGTSTRAQIEQEVISDGKTQWTYLKKDNEVQVNNANNSDDGLNPAKIFTIYEHGFKYVYNGDVKVNGKICQEIDLTPLQDKSYFKIRLEIDKARKLIYSAVIFDKNGNRYTYTLTNFVPDIKVPNNTFTFEPQMHKGIDVVDLR